MGWNRLKRIWNAKPSAEQPSNPAKPEVRLDANEVERVNQQTLSFIAHIEDKIALASSLGETNPWRGLSTLGHIDLLRSQIYPAYDKCIESIDVILRQSPVESLSTTRQSLINCFQKVEQLSDILQVRIKNFVEYLSEHHAEVRTERGVEDQFVTINQIETMNKKTAEVPPDAWDTDKLRSMDVETYTAYVRENGSGRYFLHAFPEISIKNGHIANGYGGDSLLGGYQEMRDKGGAINFVPDLGDRHSHQFYIQFGNVGGGVYYPAEVILENFPFINLPYQKDPRLVSSEWRVRGAGDVNPESKTNIIPLNLGVCFFDERDREVVEAHIAKLPANARPNKIVFHPEGSSAGWRTYSEQLRLPNDQLPKISKPIVPIANYEGTLVFGTAELAREWKEKAISPQAFFKE